MGECAQGRGDSARAAGSQAAGVLRVRHGDGREQAAPIAPGDTVLDAARRAGAMVLAPCGGAGTCGHCAVTLEERDGNGETRSRVVLACQTPAEDGMTVLLDGAGGMAVTTGGTASAPRGGAAQPGDDTRYGLAVDIGTTTIAVYLVSLPDLAIREETGLVNPQAPYGGDVISRIQAAGDPANLDALRDGVRRAIADVAADLCARRGIEPSAIERVSCAGNTVMECLAAGIDPTPLGAFPFTPPTLFGLEEDLSPLPARTYLAPAVAAYVGGDITAGIHVAGMRERVGLQLLVDIGTNGEMALGNRDGIACCATAAGPAFEGAGITFGMPALPGAISAVRLREGDLAIDVIGEDEARGLCGSGLLDAVAALLDAGVIDETGYLLDADEAADEAPPAVVARLGEEGGQAVCYLDPARRVWLSQADVRQAQLAKGAIRAGIEVLLARRGVSAGDVDELALAGGFGTHLDVRSAARIGLIPPELADRAVALGNAAGMGAVAALADEGRAALQDIAGSCDYLELSTDPGFNDAYIEAMGFDEEQPAAEGRPR